MTGSIGARTAFGASLFACRAFACLGIAGVLLWCAGRALFDLSGPQPGDAAGWDLYADVALAWSVVATVTGLVGSGAPPGRAEGGGRGPPAPQARARGGGGAARACV
ncbi:hypothetical protein, partial [Kitasatospora sp. NPDC059571]|uniref:hypothetical protein n=1 Tax=Kitasatospora sp. NPDC059571 TaxID=3346871 RepID=UPI00368FAC3D